jgi:hypothetical protein
MSGWDSHESRPSEKYVEDPRSLFYEKRVVDE